MKRYEYEIWHDLTFCGDNLVMQFNKLGREGWEFFLIKETETGTEYYARRETP